MFLLRITMASGGENKKFWWSILSSKPFQIIILCIVLGWIFFVYRWTNVTSFSKINERIYRTESKKKPTSNSADHVHIAGNANIIHNVGDNSYQVTEYKLPKEIPIIITFTNARQNANLEGKFRKTVSSLLSSSTVTLAIHIIGDKESQEIAENILKQQSSTNYRIVKIEIDELITKLDDVVKDMQKYFSASKNSYYGQSLFFLSIAIHRVMSLDMHQVIMIDCDLKFNADIKDLHKHFSHFKETNVIGIAREAQPVYRHLFSAYRSQHPNTRVGSAPPNGLTGFNSGVLLLDLDKMRTSKHYNALINAESLRTLSTKYMFKGHLGDQDFFTLASMEYEELFYVLPCTWNRQLCTWWKDNGYEQVFEEYFKCDGKINIYHGNCNTPIPD